ncbi:outer membrane protein assembly factor BamE [Marinimicrobium sp. ABcell2]|uniref:outer membrane protein assembly factor BamE n=1 Tax=Marinimicrobium sp. ABcell2 TaxID=3069751 RepID=UPI0027B153A2|nr:outer membrane protein assembly factor BamE [Marinimicrobium sp. ABcell2]MDQ2076357.1 outer membrane protein assembly factor BamE [Marinimicrobium sp. ABcell2]
MKIASRLILVAALLASLAGCSYFQFPGVHKIYIQQGHIVTQDMLDQLEPGLTKRQVRYVLGTPLLADSFNEDRWDYHYSLRQGDKTFRKRAMTVFFEDDRMTHFTGDFGRTNLEDAGEGLPAVPTNVEEDAGAFPTEPLEGEIPLPTNQ